MGPVAGLTEKPTRPRSNLKGCGFYALQPDVFDYVARTPRTALRNEYEFTVSLDIFVRDGNALHAEVMPVWDHNFTRPVDVLDCNMKWLQNNHCCSVVAKSASVNAEAELINVVVGDKASIASDARLENVVVFPGARVQTGERIHRALATPHGIVQA